MRRLVLVHSDSSISKSISEYLIAEYNFEVKVVKNFEELSGIENISFFEGIICESWYLTSDKQEAKTAKDVLNYIIDNSLNIPTLVLGTIDLSYGNYESVPDRFSLKDISSALIKILKISDDELKHLKLPDFISVSIENFYLLSNPCTDIYIQMKKGGEDHYVKRIYANDMLDKETVKKYEDNNLDHFYVRKEEFEKLMNQILGQSLKKVVQAFKSKENVMEVSADTYEISQNLLNDMGITHQTVKLAKTSIAAMNKTIASSKTLASLLRAMLENETSYAFKRNYLVSLFFYQVVPNLGWGRGEQLKQTMEKISYITFFHDITLRDESLLKIHTTDDLNSAELTDEQREHVNEHANRSTTFLQGVGGIPSGVDVIIRQHHGSLNGVGFPDVYTTGLSPMAICFIVIEKYVVEILKKIENRTPLNLPELLDELEEFFHLNSYKKIVFELRNQLPNK